jgi:glyoxylase-like metal-dependent hydrolase (beta-lactamase superfamily II)
MQFAIGDIEVNTIDDLPVMDFPLGMLLPQVDAAQLAPYLDWLQPDHFTAASATLHLACHSFLLRHAGRVILVDTCVGCGKSRPLRPSWDRRSDDGFLHRLRAAGVAPEQVDTVFCTHLHADHVGWNTRLDDGRWVPSFPKARYLIGRAEMAHWQEQVVQRGLDAVNHGAHADSVLPVLQAGQVELVDDGFDLAAGLVLRGLPGHTPGQMGLHVDRGQARALFCGDALHTPIQVPHPEWSSAICADPDAAAKTRLAMLQDAAESGRLVVPAHLRAAPYMRISATPSGLRPVFG